jgi:hypothetical protein
MRVIAGDAIYRVSVCHVNSVSPRVSFQLAGIPFRMILIASNSLEENRMKAGNSRREDLVFYVLSGLAAAWAVVCVVGLLMRAK